MTTNGYIVGIFTASQSRGAVTEHNAVQLHQGKGIVGDRHYRQRNAPENQLTLIEAEVIEAFNGQHNASIKSGDFRRNVVTRGAPLNDLVGKEFTIGSVRLRGIELCEPCAVIGKLLQQPSLSAAHVVRSLVHKGGLRAQILSNGVIRQNDPIYYEPLL
ncbi:MAG: MOSC domain-containing protein [Gammaproteobacteria bacterium HGW-Gammaproteobacteria-14]|nr:MAG: MOSC domain-containing protein [Gammaproteobacteria bacterium HGW-Gammaproteobacteria-14]